MKKTFATLGMVIGILILIMGLLFLFNVFGGYTTYPSSSGFYDSGYASFGADFYTFVNNNAAEAASAGRAASSNVGELVYLVKNAAGIFLMAMGLICFCYFGCARADAVKTEACACAAEPQESAAAEEPENACEEPETEACEVVETE